MLISEIMMKEEFKKLCHLSKPHYLVGSLLSSTMTWAIISVFGLLLTGIVSAAKHPKIVGGDDAKIQLFPYQVSLRYSGSHICGGSIISNRHILTAAHCLDDLDKDLLTIHSGTSKSDEPGNVHKIQSVHIHPEWIRSNELGYPNDIAVIILNNPIDFNKYQNKVKLPIYDIQEFQIGHVTGWGSKTKLKRIMSKDLQVVRVEVLTTGKCKSMIMHKITKKQICSFRSFGEGICYGDSGGPLVSNGKLVGIISYVETYSCADGSPDVYTNVFAYKDFIESVMNELS